MSSEDPNHPLRNLRYDLPSSLVVFLVALPLCLGIAVGSGAPPLAGLVTGIVGGLLVAWLSGSQLAVSGPAAGLTTIVLAAIATHGYTGFLLTVVLAGGMQILFGLLRGGIFAYYFPSTVIKGMLASIGIILILKQIPHALGVDMDFEGDLAFVQPDQQNTFTELWTALTHVRPGALLICGVGLAILIGWAKVPALKRIRLLPAPLVAVVAGVMLNGLFRAVVPGWALGPSPDGVEPGYLVDLPPPETLASVLRTPDFGQVFDPGIWQTAFTIAVVASIETLLCIEAIDKLDPMKRSTPTNRELMAQGAGNIVAGLLGGLPMTAVIVRGSANIQSGGRTRMSAFAHGVLLVLALLFLGSLINSIPLAALAAVLLHVGYKLAPVQLFRFMFRQPVEQWAPFMVTIVAVLFSDLLLGVAIGMVVAVFFILRANLQTPYFLHDRDIHEVHGIPYVHLELSENVSFLNRASVSKVLHDLNGPQVVHIDGRGSQYIHPDVVELIHEFADTAHLRDIQVELEDIPALGTSVPAH